MSLNSLHNGNFGAFGGAMARAIWAWHPLRGSPWVLKYPYCHSIITQTHPMGGRRVFEKVEFFGNLAGVTKQPSSVKTAKSSLARAHRGGRGGAGGTWSSDPGPPPWVRGSMYKRKFAPDLGSNPHTAPRIRKEVLTPPPTPPPPKRGTRVRGAKGVKNKKFIGGSFSLLK